MFCVFVFCFINTDSINIVVHASITDSINTVVHASISYIGKTPDLEMKSMGQIVSTF